jgi:hypothetical protein
MYSWHSMVTTVITFTSQYNIYCKMQNDPLPLLINVDDNHPHTEIQLADRHVGFFGHVGMLTYITIPGSLQGVIQEQTIIMVLNKTIIHH